MQSQPWHECHLLPGRRAWDHCAEHDGAVVAEVLQGARHADGQATAAGESVAHEAARVLGNL